MPKRLGKSLSYIIFFFLFIALFWGVYFLPTNLQAHITNSRSVSEDQNRLGVGYAVAKEFPMEVDGISLIDMVLDPSSSTIFALYRINLVVQIDLGTGETNRFSVPMDTSTLAVSPDGKKLYVTRFEEVHVYDVATAALIDTYEYDIRIQNIVAGSNNRLYIVGTKKESVETLSVVEMIDTTDGRVIDSFILADERSGHILEMSPNKETLFVARQSPFHPSIHKFDVTGDNFMELVSNDLEAEPASITLPGNGNYLLLGLVNGKFLRYDPESLEIINTLILNAGEVGGVADVSVSSNGDEFAILFRILGLHPTGELKTYSAVNGNELRSYAHFEESGDVIAITFFENGRIALMKRSALEILTPTYHGVALPLIVNNYCTTPLIDDFSDPDSGWPIAESSSTIYQYVNDEYQIYHHEADRWIAVTRGNVVQEAETLSVEGRLANNRDGVWGLLFGLNDDWSDFYTFEILPHHQMWVQLHYNSETGWETIQSGSSSAINPGSQLNELRIRAAYGSFLLNINGSQVVVEIKRPGRVGMTGGSFEPNVDLRYDNYLFADDNCPVPTAIREPLITKSFINSDIDHPGLESLLQVGQED